MAYADQTMSTRKVVSIGLVVLLHVAIGYAFITGLAFNVVKKVAQDLKVVDIQEAPPPPEQPPPPPPPEQKFEPPPVVAPPPLVRTPTIAPPIQSVPVPPPYVAPITPTAAVAPPAPPAPPQPSKAAAAKGNPASWVTTDDYPPSSLRNEEQGTSGLTFDVDAAGRVQNCRVTSSSGSATLDDTACRLVTRRGRYSPALDTTGNPIAGGTKSLRFTWRLPES